MITAILQLAFAAEYGPSMEGDVVVAEAVQPSDTGVVGCSDQYLHDAVLLPELPLFFRSVQPNHSWGTQEMIDVIVDTARHMRWLMPEADPITVGDISARRGGFLSGHKTHRGGVDADLGIYSTGGKQNPRGFDQLGASDFDVAVNWMYISTLLDTGKVDMILLDRSHIARLRAYTLRTGLLSEEEASQIFPQEGTRGTWANTGFVRHAPNHADHIHLRVLCSDGSKAN